MLRGSILKFDRVITA
jgi:hypothetical protein